MGRKETTQESTMLATLFKLSHVSFGSNIIFGGRKGIITQISIATSDFHNCGLTRDSNAKFEVTRG